MNDLSSQSGQWRLGNLITFYHISRHLVSKQIQLHWSTGLLCTGILQLECKTYFICQIRLQLRCRKVISYVPMGSTQVATSGQVLSGGAGIHRSNRHAREKLNRQQCQKVNPDTG